MQLTVTNKELGIEIVRLRKESRETVNQLRRRVRAAAAPLKDAVVASALEDGLHKAAAATSVRQSYTTGGAAIKVVVVNRKARYARFQGGIDRHPVFARPDQTRDQWHWVNQPVPPFFDQGTARGSEAASAEVGRVLDDIAQTL
jgi:hypothetical protein